MGGQNEYVAWEKKPTSNIGKWIAEKPNWGLQSDEQTPKKRQKDKETGFFGPWVNWLATKAVGINHFTFISEQCQPFATGL